MCQPITGSFQEGGRRDSPGKGDVVMEPELGVMHLEIEGEVTSQEVQQPPGPG